MSAKQGQLTWNVQAADPPKLTTNQWAVSGIAGIVLLVGAILQLISFSDFRNTLNQMGLPGPTAWAVCIVLAEIWGAAVFFKLRLSYLFRVFSASLAVLVTGFWFIENLQLISNGRGESLRSSDFFGSFLRQQPGWWTAVEITILLFLVMWTIDLSRGTFTTPRRK